MGVSHCQNAWRRHWRKVEVAVALLPCGGHHCQVRHLSFVGPQPGRGGRISAGVCSGEVYETGELSPAPGAGGRCLARPCEGARGADVKKRIGKFLRVMMVSNWLWSCSVNDELCFTCDDKACFDIWKKPCKQMLFQFPLCKDFTPFLVCACTMLRVSLLPKNLHEKLLIEVDFGKCYCLVCALQLGK